MSGDPADLSVRLRWTDAWLLTAIAGAKPRSEPVNLAEMLESADWVNRGMPSFDVVSFGLQRLLVAGFVTIEHPPEGGLFIRAVGIPVAVVRAGRADYNRRRRVGLNVGSLGDSVTAMSAAIGAGPDSDP
jgi:hypothetical protein